MLRRTSWDTSADDNKMKRMSTASMRSVTLRQAAPIFDKYLIVPLIACAYCLVIAPMVQFAYPADTTTTANQIFWPLVAAIALGCWASGNRSRLIWPPHIIWLAAYLALAAASTLWAFNPNISFTRFATQLMMLISIILPAMLAVRTADMMRGVFFFLAFGSILNGVLILGGYSHLMMAGTEDEGYVGYFTDKNTLGQFAALAILLSLYQIFHTGWPRALGLIIVVTSTYLVLAAHSKAALGCVVLATILANLALFMGKKMRVSPAIVLLSLPIGYAVLSRAVGNIANRISWYIFHNYNLSGRTDIWDFVNFEIAKRPLLGWGYESFWLTGPNSPAQKLEAGWGC